MADLHRQLRYAPAETRERQMAAAETLAGEIEPGRAYPEEFITFRITQYRARGKEEHLMLVGAAVLADLATFVQSLSGHLTLAARDDARGVAMPVALLAENLGIATRTLRRYHRRGLLLHYVRFDDGEQRLACYERSLDMFRRREPELLARAGMYTRLSDEDEQSLIDEALQLHAHEGLSRQEISRRLAARNGRAVETIRALLARAEKDQGGRLFKGTRRMSPRDEALVIRAWSRGVPVRDIAARLGRSGLTIRRSINDHRRARLRAISLAWIDLPTFSLPEAEDVILSAPSVQAALATVSGAVDAILLLEQLRESSHGDEPADRALVEEAQLAAYNLLKKRVTAASTELPAFPTDDDLDRVERDVRWAAMLKKAIVWSALAAAIVRIEQNFARPLHQQSSDQIRRLLRIAVRETSDAVEAADPSREQRAVAQAHAISSTPVERIAALAIDKDLARLGLGRSGSAAGARHARGSVPMSDPLADLCAWAPAFELPARFLARLGSLDEASRRLVVEHYGVAGSRPLTPRELAAKHGLSLRAVASRLQAAHLALRHRTDNVG